MVWCKSWLLMMSNVFFLSPAVLFIHPLFGVVQIPGGAGSVKCVRLKRPFAVSPYRNRDPVTCG